MEISYFDLVVGVIILLLGLKGIINGFFKELFGLIGIIGGIFIATRVGDTVGQFISNSLFHFESQAPISFTGFLVTFALFWVLMIVAGILFKKLSKISGLGPVDRIFGFVIGSGKFFLIGAVIAYSLYNIRVIRDNVESMMETSLLFPMLVSTGQVIMKIDPVDMGQELNATVGEKLDEAVNKATEKAVETAKEKIMNGDIEIPESTQQKVEEVSKEVIEKISTQIDENLTAQ